MTTILAIIGLIVIMHYLSKGLIKMGDWLINVSESMKSYSSAVNYKQEENINTAIKEQVEKELSKKLQNTKGVKNEDKNFTDKIRREIDELTK